MVAGKGPAGTIGNRIANARSSDQVKQLIGIDNFLESSDIGVTVQGYDSDLAAIAGLSGVQGDIIYRDASQWQRLAKGTASQVLTMNAGATAPEWAAAAGGGSIETQEGGTTIVASTTALDFDATAFAVTDSGGGTASIDVDGALKDIDSISFSQGDILYHNGTDIVRLAKGTAEQVLAMNSGATAPEWVDPGNGGFRAYQNTAQTNATGDGTEFTVQLDAESHDVDGEFNTTTDTFTAGTTGYYHITGQVYLNQTSHASHTSGYATLYKNGTTYLSTHLMACASESQIVPQVHWLGSLTAADTVVLRASVAGSSKTVDTVASPTLTYLQARFLGV